MNKLRTTAILSFMGFWLLPAVMRVTNIGIDDGTPVTHYGGTQHFNGKLDKVTIEVKSKY